MKIHNADGTIHDIQDDVAQMHAERIADPHNGVVTFDGILREKPKAKVETPKAKK